ncbi:hypothetical protein H1P_900008 [Hyella patelloides LEGE 07179]|uniref:Uncharacterized protein n=1 Tax=Hyella patelloides LEGE 07179 TaxID=945734 RepID=A0A563W531_9CYAN|nr:hypothetical protein H1P_900008 [Hyella patelloides LEGE 07179]
MLCRIYLEFVRQKCEFSFEQFLKENLDSSFLQNEKLANKLGEIGRVRNVYYWSNQPQQLSKPYCGY